MKTNFNSLKRRVLKILAEDGNWVSVPGIAKRVKLPYPDRGLYPYLRRLSSFGLIVSGRNNDRRLFYHITARGLQRLQFLNEKEH
jgi:DNA-binding PadR family transcriptional regulator